MHGLTDIKRMNEDAAARQTVEHKPDEAPCPAAEAGVAALDDKLAGGLPVDGWIAHRPSSRRGLMPVPGDMLVDIQLRDGMRAFGHPANSWNWHECGIGAIALYRIAEAKRSPAPTAGETVEECDVTERKASTDQPWKDYYKRLAAKAAPAVTTKAGHGPHLPTDAKARKALPICTGVLDYFPDALAAVAEVSRIGNDQHNPGQPLHWSKGKSTDHADCALRHFAERGTRDTDGGLHTAKAAWRVLAQLQMEIEAERAGLSFNDYIAKLNREAA